MKCLRFRKQVISQVAGIALVGITCGLAHAQEARRATTSAELAGGAGAVDSLSGPGAAGLVRFSLNSRAAIIMLEYQGGEPVMRIRGRTEIFPIRITGHSGLSGETAAGGQLSFVPLTAEGQATLNQIVSGVGSNRSYIFAGPAMAYELGWINANALFQPGLTMGRFRVSTSISGGAAADADGGQGIVGATYRAEGELIFNVGCSSVPGLNISSNGASARGIACHGIRVAGHAGGVYNFLNNSFTHSEGGSVGYQIGAPGPSGNLFIQFEGNRNNHSDVLNGAGASGLDSGESFFLGGSAGIHF